MPNRLRTLIRPGGTTLDLYGIKHSAASVPARAEGL
jgi:hypothetical protein